VVPLLKRMAPAVRIVVMQHDIAVSRRIFRCSYRPMLRAAPVVAATHEMLKDKIDGTGRQFLTRV